MFYIYKHTMDSINMVIRVTNSTVGTLHTFYLSTNHLWLVETYDCAHDILFVVTWYR